MASISSTSSTTSSTSYNRITGLATGLDTDAMVKQSLQAYQTKVDQAKQARDLQVFKQTLYRDTIKDLRSIFTKYTDISKADSMLLTKNYGTSKFTSTDENAVKAEGLAGAKVGNYKVQVNKLAEPARVEINDVSALKGNKINIDVNGTKVDIDLTSATDESTIITTINSQMKNAGVAAKITKSDLSGKLILETTATGSSQKITLSNITKTTNNTEVDLTNVANKNLGFTINGKSVQVDLTGVTTEADVLAKLKSSLSSNGVDVQGDGAGKITFESTIASASNSMSIVDISSASTSSPIVSTTGVVETADKSLTDTGTKSNVTITDSYGNTATNEYDNNSFTIDNVKFTVTDVTDSAVSVVGKNDATALKDKLVEFVNDYNKVIESITTKLNEKKDLNYKPLTDEQRESMTDDQIEKWETKVKQGLLKRDNDLTQITSELRRAFTDSIQGTGLTLKQLGIDFSSDTSKAGQLVVDEETLTSGLEENADEVVNLFAKAAPSNLTDKKISTITLEYSRELRVY